MAIALLTICSFLLFYKGYKDSDVRDGDLSALFLCWETLAIVLSPLLFLLVTLAMTYSGYIGGELSFTDDPNYMPDY